MFPLMLVSKKLLHVMNAWTIYNRAISQIPQCNRLILHNAPFCNRNAHTCAYCCEIGVVGYGPDALRDLWDQEIQFLTFSVQKPDFLEQTSVIQFSWIKRIHYMCRVRCRRVYRYFRHLLVHSTRIDFETLFDRLVTKTGIFKRGCCYSRHTNENLSLFYK